MKVVELKFFNYDATPNETKIYVQNESIKPILAWYGAYYAGDRYNVFKDGKRVEIDHNGEIPEKTISLTKDYDGSDYGMPWLTEDDFE